MGKKIIAIGAHYDDIELGCSGTLIKHVQSGDKVTMLVIADSAYENLNGEVIRSRNKRSTIVSDLYDF